MYVYVCVRVCVTVHVCVRVLMSLRGDAFSSCLCVGDALQIWARDGNVLNKLSWAADMRALFGYRTNAHR